MGLAQETQGLGGASAPAGRALTPLGARTARRPPRQGRAHRGLGPAFSSGVG